MFDVFKDLYERRGFAGFFRGYRPAIVKLVTANMCNFGVYETMKKKFSVKL